MIEIKADKLFPVVTHAGDEDETVCFEKLEVTVTDISPAIALADYGKIAETLNLPQKVEVINGKD